MGCGLRCQKPLGVNKNPAVHPLGSPVALAEQVLQACLKGGPELQLTEATGLPPLLDRLKAGWTLQRWRRWRIGGEKRQSSSRELVPVRFHRLPPKLAAGFRLPPFARILGVIALELVAQHAERLVECLGHYGREHQRPEGAC